MIKKLTAILSVMMLVAASVMFTPSVSAASQPRDCDNNAIVKCGAYDMPELKGKMDADIRKIYAHYGIAESEMNSGVANGVVRKDGKVVVNGQVVATNLVSAGRQPLRGGTKVPGLNIYEHTPANSFASNEIPAFVKITNGQFEWAIIKSCGNPVRATPIPPKKPNISIQKSVDKDTVKLNEVFNYTVIVKNTGEVALKNAVVSDPSPTGVEFIPNSTAGVSKTIFQTTIPELAVGASKTFTFKAKAVKEMKGKIVNTACVTAPQVPGGKKCAPAENSMVCVNKPQFPVGSPECKEVPPVVVEEKPKPEQPQPTPPQVLGAVAEKPVILPSTGPGIVFGVAGSTSVASYLGSLLYRRARRYFNL
ncbi:MAG: hypothetical protein JWL85_8 [Candidatus Saccharibacteria bacterium]|nr:hypothetical protein [Candidatus Saccharibacteria bacterium]